MFDKEMQAALIADGEKLAALTGEDHGPYFVEGLLPCPFCGGKPVRQDIEYDTMGAVPDDPNYGGSFIECDDCGACSRLEFGFKENLVSSWNRRT